MDIADNAQQAIDQSLAVALERAKLTGNEALTGFCHWCHEPTKGAFCSSGCRNDSDKRDRMRL